MTINPSLLEQHPRLIPDDSGKLCLMMFSSRTLEVRPLTSFPLSRVCTDDGREGIHSLTHEYPKSKTKNSPKVMYSASSPLPLLLESNVEGDIREGCYLLHRDGLLQRP